MKYLPWLLLAAVIAYPLLAQTSTPSARPVKVFGQPAASDWIDIESNDANGSPTQYIVPAGKVLVLESLLRRHDFGGGDLLAAVYKDGASVLRDGPGQLLLYASQQTAASSKPGLFFDEVAREGQVIVVERLAGDTAPQEATFILRGWLEDIR